MKYLKKFDTEAEYQAFLADGYETPNVSLIEESGAIKYNIPLGVFIQHIDGTLYTTDKWTAGGFANDQANGVAVCDINASFVIAKTLLGSMAWSSDTSNAVEGVMTTTSKSTAKNDYAGAANTALIAAIDTGKAAYSCANFVFPNGANGYLPAFGEWQVAYNNKTAVNAAMSLIGGTSLGSIYYWSSTQYSADSAWLVNWSNGYASNSGKDNDRYVRAFSAL